MEEHNANISLKWGAIAGSLYVFITYILYLIFKDARACSVSSPYTYIPYVSLIVILVIAGLQKRKILGGQMGFRVGISNIYMVYVICFVVYSIFLFALYNYIDVKLAASDKALTEQLMNNPMAKSFFGADTIKMQLESLTVADYNYSVRRCVQFLLENFMKGFFVCSIIALVLRRSKAKA